MTARTLDQSLGCIHGGSSGVVDIHSLSAVNIWHTSSVRIVLPTALTGQIVKSSLTGGASNLQPGKGTRVLL